MPFAQTGVWWYANLIHTNREIKNTFSLNHCVLIGTISDKSFKYLIRSVIQSKLFYAFESAFKCDVAIQNGTLHVFFVCRCECKHHENRTNLLQGCAYKSQQPEQKFNKVCLLICYLICLLLCIFFSAFLCAQMHKVQKLFGFFLYVCNQVKSIQSQQTERWERKK